MNRVVFYFVYLRIFFMGDNVRTMNKTRAIHQIHEKKIQCQHRVPRKSAMSENASSEASNCCVSGDSFLGWIALICTQ